MARLSKNIIPKMTNYTTPSGTASASTDYGDSWKAWKAFDGSVDDYGWVTANGTTTGWLSYKFPSKLVVVSYSIIMKTGAQADSPNTWTFEGSIDGTNWVVLDTQINISFSVSLVQKFEFKNYDSFLYYRINITKNNGTSFTRISELEMYSPIYEHKILLSSNKKYYSTIPKKLSNETIIPIMTNNAAPSGLAFSKGAMGGNEAYLAFNQTDENEGYCSTSSSGGVGFLGYKFTSPKIISQYAVRNGTLNSYYKRLPRDWTFEGSNNSTNGTDGTWEVLDRQSKQIWSTPTTDKVFEIDNIKAYTAYRINWTANNGATDYTSVGELKLFELLNIPSLIEMTHNNESSFQRYGMNLDNPLNLSSRLNRHTDVQSSSVVLGLGKVFKHKVDLNEKRVGKIIFK